MLSSIHPLGERAKGNSFGLTATAFVVGSLVGGATTGALAGALGLALPPLPATELIAAIAVAMAVVEVRGWRLPSLRRQVNEDWLQTYRGWVYGAGFGFQLGTGVLTIITTAAIPVAVAAAVLVDDLAGAVAIMATFGLLRGLSLVPARSIDSPDQLFEFHRRLQRRSPTVHSASVTTMVLTGVAATAVALL